MLYDIVHNTSRPAAESSSNRHRYFEHVVLGSLFDDGAVFGHLHFCCSLRCPQRSCFCFSIAGCDGFMRWRDLHIYSGLFSSIADMVCCGCEKYENLLLE